MAALPLALSVTGANRFSLRTPVGCLDTSFIATLRAQTAPLSRILLRQLSVGSEVVSQTVIVHPVPVSDMVINRHIAFKLVSVKHLPLRGPQPTVTQSPTVVTFDRRDTLGLEVTTAAQDPCASANSTLNNRMAFCAAPAMNTHDRTHTRESWRRQRTRP
jgi:hypothetical protein